MTGPHHSSSLEPLIGQVREASYFAEWEYFISGNTGA